MPRGGARRGTPGRAYPQRSDLNKPVPMTAAPGQTYGQAGAQLAAQKQMPMAPQPIPTPGATPPATPAVAPGSLGPLTAPTNRPDEPLTAGAPVGPGPNSISGLPPLPSPQVSQYTTARDLLTGLATAQPDNAALSYLASAATRGM